MGIPVFSEFVMKKRWSASFYFLLLGILVFILTSAGIAPAATDTFTASGNWTAPAGVTSITVEAWGGGGAGGGTTSNPAKGGGGAGGQYASKVVTVIPGNVYAVVVGAGGAGSTGNGAAGGDSTFAATTVVAKGGAGGTAAANGVAGLGSASNGVGAIVWAGGSGSDGAASAGTGGAGGGGAGSNGAGGNASGNTAGTGTANGGGDGGAGLTSRGTGNAGSLAGGGGGGGYATNNTYRSGGNGAAGRVVISYASLPSVTTNSATALTRTGATLNGTVSSNGASTTVTFDYGLSNSYGSTVTAAQSPLAADASGSAVSASLADLTCGTSYHFRAKGVNSAGTTNGLDRTFTTSACPTAPTVTTNAATAVTGTGSTLNGMVSSNGASTMVTFDYGLSNSYGSTVTAAQSPLDADVSGIAVSATLTDLICNTTYHFRAKGVNSAGTTNGLDRTFTTSNCSTVTSIVRANPDPTSAATVSWTVTFNKSVTGVNATAFSLVAGGVSGAFISAVTGSGTTWTVTANTGIGSGTLGLNQSGPGAVSPALNGTYTGEVYTISSTPALAEYRMDELLWNGTAGEVKDSSGNGYDGQAFNSATTGNVSPVPVGTCRYGVFDNGTTITKGYVLSPLPDQTADFTITAWIKTTDNTKSGQRILIDDQNNTGGYGFSLADVMGESGGTRGHLRFFSRNISPVSLDSTYTIANNTWYFVAAVADITNKTRTIYVFDSAGTFLNSTGGAWTGTWGTDSGPVSIGAETNASGEPPSPNFHFYGNLDEVRMYPKVLNQDALATIATQSHPCAGAAPDHLLLAHDGSAISCIPEAVVVTACANADCSSLYTSGVTGNLTAGGNSVAFTILSGQSQTTVSIHLPSDSALADPQTVRLGTSSVLPVITGTVSPYCSKNSGIPDSTTACDMSVYKAGFLFDVPNLTSGTASGPVNVSAVRSSNNSACVPLFQNVTRSVALWANYQNPASGTLPLKVNGVNIETTATPLYTSTFSMAFNNSGVALLTSVQYDDVGLMQLNGRYVGSSANTPPDVGMIVLGSDTFVVKPDHFDLTGIQQTAVPNLVNPAAADASGNKFVKAGEQFTVTVTAKNVLGVTTPNYGQETTPESVKLTSTVVAGLGLAYNPTIGGSFGAFTSGVATGTTFSWDEVGIITLTPSIGDGDYLGAGNVTGTVSGNVGRFIPDHFEVTGSNGTMAAACSSGSFTYTGQAMGYGTAPSLTIKPMNAAASSSVTRNYSGGFQKLTASGIKVTAPISDGTRNGKDGATKTTLLSTLKTGTLTNSSGTLTYTLASDDQYTYTRDANALIGIYTCDIPLVVAEVSEPAVDSVTAAGTLPTLKPAGVGIRYGRVKIFNNFGPETADITSSPFEAQYYDGTNWVVNTNDNCTTGLTFCPAGRISAIHPVPPAPLAFGKGTFTVSRPDSVKVCLTAPVWLTAVTDCAAPDSSCGDFTFGIYRGNDRIINWQEIIR